MDRLALMQADPECHEEVRRLMSNPDEPLTLAQVATRLGLPKKAFREWFERDHAESIEGAHRDLGEHLIKSAVKLVANPTAENIAIVKVQTDRLIKIAGLMNARYSPRVEHKHEGGGAVFNVTIMQAAPAVAGGRVIEGTQVASGELPVAVARNEPI